YCLLANGFQFPVGTKQPRMKLVTTKTVDKRAIAPFFFVHSTLRNFILLSHLPNHFSLVTTDHARSQTSSLCYPMKPEPVLCQPRAIIRGILTMHILPLFIPDSSKTQRRTSTLVLAFFFLGRFLPVSLH